MEASRRWAADGIAVNALNPGSHLGHGAGGGTSTLLRPPFDPSGKTGVSEKTVAQGAATSVLLAASPLVEGVTGRYFEERAAGRAVQAPACAAGWRTTRSTRRTRACCGAVGTVHRRRSLTR
ncbi:hypothetical protein ACRAWC_23460 [Leifsonia sp. L25]|uniref:hypothetical protein n=1 Tax=Leifsonia sp. L25 TaxID=3423957 RepID=UPI003D68B997